MVVAQIDLLVDYKSAGIASALIFIGLFLLFIGRLRMQRAWDDTLNINKIIYSMGICLIFYETFTRFTIISVVLLLLGVNLLEGASAVAFYQKLRYSLMEQKLVSKKSFSNRILYHLIILFLVLMSGFLLIFGIGLGLFESPFEGFKYVWTGVILVLSVIGMSWKLWGIKGNVPFESIIGFSLLVGGLTIYNATFEVEIMIIAVSNVIYGFGFWMAVWLIVKHDGDISEASIEKMGKNYTITRVLRNIID